MDEEFGKDFISISDEDGNSYELEHLDTIELDGVFYMAFLPTDVDENSENYGIVILKSEKGEDGDDYLVVPDDDEAERAYDQFMRELFTDEE